MLAFYPADWSPVCSDQMALYQAVRPAFDAYDAAVIGVSVDGVWCHRAFAESRDSAVPVAGRLRAQGEPSRGGTASYDASAGEAERNLFVIDPDGDVFWNYRSPEGVNPGADGILAALEPCGTGERTRDQPRRSTSRPAAWSSRSTPDDHVRGPDSAAVTLVEYGDYQCPYCGAAYPIVESLLAHRPDTVRFVFRHFPLTDLHPHAETAAEQAEAAGGPGPVLARP